MTGCGLALALALLVLPPPHRRLTRRTAIAAGRVRLAGIGCAISVAAVAALLVPAGVAATGIIVALTATARWRRHTRATRGVTQTRDLEGALDVLVGELRVGAHPVTAFGIAAAEVEGTVGSSFREMAARARLGADVAAGLHSVAARSPSPASWERIAVSWQLAQTHGLTMATLMRAAQNDIVERQRFAARVTAAMAGARATAAILTGLPLLGIGLGQLIGANPVRFLCSDGPGAVMLVVGVMLACSGLLWSDRITNAVIA